MSDKQFFSNYETWFAKTTLDESAFGSIKNAVAMYKSSVVGLAIFLKELYIENIPDEFPEIPYKAMIRYTIENRIDFEEIAEAYLVEDSITFE